jgi:cysteine desulfuration protein SufE
MTLPEILADYEILDPDDRYRLLIDLGRDLEPMPDPLKTDATLVRGCSASVWVYPTKTDDNRLHFLADSNAAITKGIIALVLVARHLRSLRLTSKANWHPLRSRLNSVQIGLRVFPT